MQKIKLWIVRILNKKPKNLTVKEERCSPTQKELFSNIAGDNFSNRRNTITSKIFIEKSSFAS